MATISNIVINIKGSSDHARKAFEDTTKAAKKMSADTEALNAGLSKLGNIPGINIMVQQFEKAKGMLGSLGSMGAGALAGMGIGLVAEGVGAAVSKITGMISASIESAHALKLQSQELGISAERFQAYSRMAGKFGVDSEQASHGMEKLVTQIGELRAGSEEAEGKFAKFGLSARQVASMSNTDVYGAIAEKIKNAGSAADKAALAAEIFGEKLGPKMVNMLSQGRAGIDQMMGKMSASGKLLTAGEIADMEALQTSWKKLKDAGESIWNSIMKAITPVLKVIADVVADVAKGIEELIDGWRRLWGQITGQPPVKAPKPVEEKGDVAAYDNAQYEKAAKRVADLQREADQAGKTKLELEALNLARDASRSGDPRMKALADQVVFMAQREQQEKEHTKELEKQAQHLDQLKAKAKELADSLNPAQKLRDTQKELDEMVKAGLLSTAQAAQQIAKLRVEMFKQMMSAVPKLDTGYVEFGSQAAAQLQAQQRAEDLQKQYAEQTLTAMEKQLDEQKNTNRLFGQLLDKTGQDKVMDIL